MSARRLIAVYCPTPVCDDQPDCFLSAYKQPNNQRITILRDLRHLQFFIIIKHSRSVRDTTPMQARTYQMRVVFLVSPAPEQESPGFGSFCVMRGARQANQIGEAGRQMIMGSMQCTLTMDGAHRNTHMVPHPLEARADATTRFSRTELGYHARFA